MNIFAKIQRLREECEEIKGPFRFLALARRANSVGKWDLIAAAPWLATNRREGLDFIASKMQQLLKPREIVLISRIAVLDVADPEISMLEEREGLKGGRRQSTAHRLNVRFREVEIEELVVFVASNGALETRKAVRTAAHSTL